MAASSKQRIVRRATTLNKQKARKKITTKGTATLSEQKISKQ
jgi:hypothetical protein